MRDLNWRVTEMELRLAAFKATLDGLTRDVAELARDIQAASQP